MSPKPFLKWAGGKRKLTDRILHKFPKDWDPFTGTYYEPFLGGGAVFFALVAAMNEGIGPLVEKAVLGDANEELVRTYRAVQLDVEPLIRQLSRFGEQGACADPQCDGLTRRHYEFVRALDVDPMCDCRVATRMIYLNKLGFNGLYRVNGSGRFNVAFGKYKNPTICDADNLRECNRALRCASVASVDFESLVSGAKQGDVIYFDPPYEPLSKTANFTGYTNGWSKKDPERLATLFRMLAGRGAFPIVSNHDTPEVREMYQGFQIERVEMIRSINSRGDRRRAVGEVLVTP